MAEQSSGVGGSPTVVGVRTKRSTRRRPTGFTDAPDTPTIRNAAVPVELRPDTTDSWAAPLS
jgi:hypothetical protein